MTSNESVSEKVEATYHVAVLCESWVGFFNLCTAMCGAIVRGRRYFDVGHMRFYCFMIDDSQALAGLQLHDVVDITHCDELPRDLLETLQSRMRRDV